MSTTRLVLFFSASKSYYPSQRAPRSSFFPALHSLVNTLLSRYILNLDRRPFLLSTNKRGTVTTCSPDRTVWRLRHTILPEHPHKGSFTRSVRSRVYPVSSTKLHPVSIELLGSSRNYNATDRLQILFPSSNCEATEPRLPLPEKRKPPLIFHRVLRLSPLSPFSFITHSVHSQHGAAKEGVGH